MPYSVDSQGTIWTPQKNRKTEVCEELLESLKKSFNNPDDHWLGDFNQGSFIMEEMYIQDYNGDPTLDINGMIEDLNISLSIPIKNNSDMKKLVQKLNKYVTIDKKSSGLYLKPKDFLEVRTKTADGQGRINLGMDKAGQDVKVVVLQK